MHPRKLAPWLTVLLALALASCGGEATKDLATLDGDGFSVSMPGEPMRNEESVPTPNGTVKAILYTSDSKEGAFTIAYTQLPEGVRGDLKGAIKGSAANVGGTVREEAATTYKGYKARDARTTGVADDKGTLFIRAILAKDRLYLLQFVGDGPNLKKAPSAYAEIVNSLVIE